MASSVTATRTAERTRDRCPRVCDVLVGPGCCEWPVARVDWSAVTAERVASFVRTQVDTLSRTSSRAPVTAVRSFVRFLVSSGVVRVGLEGAVPTVRQWKFGTLPRALTTADVQRILQTVEATTPDGARDYAILLLLS